MQMMIRQMWLGFDSLLFIFGRLQAKMCCQNRRMTSNLSRVNVCKFNFLRSKTPNFTLSLGFLVSGASVEEFILKF